MEKMVEVVNKKIDEKLKKSQPNAKAAIMSLIKDEIQELESVFMNNKDEDGVKGESTLWKLTQGITAIARNKTEERKRELQEFAGSLFKRLEK